MRWAGRRGRALALGAALLVVPVACGGGGAGTGQRVPGRMLTVYAGTPLVGPYAALGRDTVDAERLALARARGRVGPYRIRLRVRDDADPHTGHWDAGMVAANARRAASDPTTIAYLGDLASGASAIAVPILSEAGIAQVSPASSHTGLTRSAGGAPGEPEKYYPGVRNFVRVVPTDAVQAAAQVAALTGAGVRALFVIDDRSLEGGGIADLVAADARQAGIRITGRVSSTLSTRGAATGLARRVAASRATGVFVGADAAPGIVGLFHALHRDDPSLRLFGPDTLALRWFTARLGEAAGATTLTAPVAMTRGRGAAARRFRRAFRHAYGHPPAPRADDGYAAMRLLLEAIRRAGPRGNDRPAVLTGLFKARLSGGPLGAFGIDRWGDATRSGYGIDRVRGGCPVRVRTLVLAHVASGAGA